MFNMDMMSIPDKQALAVACGMRWACQVRCDQDYSAVCPKAWVHMFGLCMAPAGYAGKCSHSVNTTRMTAAQTQRFADHCGLAFPCVGTHSGSGSDIAGLGNGPVGAPGGRSEVRVVPEAAGQLPGSAQRFAARFAMPEGPLSSVYEA